MIGCILLLSAPHHTCGSPQRGESQLPFTEGSLSARSAQLLCRCSPSLDVNVAWAEQEEL